MTHDAYSTKRVTVWREARDGQEGYAIKYQDGYISWCPSAIYVRDYQPITAMSFGHAVHALKRGKRVARLGWNGKDMFLFLVPGSTFTVNRAPLLGFFPEGTPIKYHAHIDMKTATGEIVPWLASQTDVLADDWLILGEV
jgi:hypothetical protein